MLDVVKRAGFEKCRELRAKRWCAFRWVCLLVLALMVFNEVILISLGNVVPRDFLSYVIFPIVPAVMLICIDVWSRRSQRSEKGRSDH